MLGEISHSARRPVCSCADALPNTKEPVLTTKRGFVSVHHHRTSSLIQAVSREGLTAPSPPGLPARQGGDLDFDQPCRSWSPGKVHMVTCNEDEEAPKVFISN